MGQSSAQTLDEQVILGQVDSLIALSRKAFREGDQGLANTLAAGPRIWPAVNRENSPCLHSGMLRKGRPVSATRAIPTG